MYDVVKFNCDKVPQIESVSKATKPVTSQDKQTKETVMASIQSLEYQACGEYKKVTLHYFIYGNDKPAKLYYSIGTKNDPAPLVRTMFSGSFTSALLKHDTLDNIQRYLYSKRCSTSKEQLEQNTSFYVASVLKRISTISNHKRVSVLQWGETWNVNACNKSYMFPITFTGDGVGGTYWSIGKVTEE
ncbi:hypothetical protein FLM55_06195 [Francisella sp. Scap27]|nr:hypothetical protein FLM55_06195 [Francisella sp. Scap27]